MHTGFRKKLGPALAAMALALGLIYVGAASPAGAEPATSPICHTAGTALSGNHRNLVVRGDNYVPKDATLNVSGNLWLAPGSCVDGFSLSTVHVGHNIVVSPKATLALGCAPYVNLSGPPLPGGLAPCFLNPPTHDTVGGSIVAMSPRTMYLTAVTVGRDVVSIGGGQPGASFPVKDMTIHGNLTVVGWNGGPGGWIGLLRNHVDGNVTFAFNSGTRLNDSSEIDSNTIGRNLVCVANSPAAQFGDAPPPLVNTVGGRAIGECANLTTEPASAGSLPG